MLRWDSLFGDRLTKGQRRKRRSNDHSNRRLAVETLEDRRMLAIDLSPFDPSVMKMGWDLAVLAEEYKSYELQEDTQGFTPSNGSLQMFGSEVVIDAVAKNDVASLQADLTNAGITVTGTYGRLASALIPLASLDVLTSIENLAFAKPVYAGSGIGATTSQGDQSLGSDLIKSLLGIDGTGVDVAVLSDSFASLPGAGVGIGTGDLPGPGNPNGFTNSVNVVQDLPAGILDEVQQISISGAPTGGTFTLQFNDGGTIATTAGIPFNATAAQVQTALLGLPNVAPGDIAVGGGALPGAPVTVTFQGNLGRANLPQMTANSFGLTGGVNPIASVTTLINGAFGNQSGIDEGRAMLEIVHDIAPGSDLLFATAALGQASFAANIAALQAAGADVIIDDWFYFEEPFFQDGVISQAVDAAVAAGSSYFALANNHSRNSYESVYRFGQNFAAAAFPSTTGPAFQGGRAHDFDPSGATDVMQQFTLQDNQSIRISMQWDQPFFSVSGGAGSTNNVDLYILDAANNVVAGSIRANIGQDPSELVTFTNTTDAAANFNLMIVHNGAVANDPGFVKYINLTNGDPGMGALEFDTNSGTAYGHANSATGNSVGAASWIDTPAFGASLPQLENFSSAGGIGIRFDIAGNAIGPILRQTPNIVAPDDGNNTFFGRDIAADADTFPNFPGTSAAAPHAGALAALMLQFNPNLTPEQIKEALQETAIDMDDTFTPGFDVGFDQGTGFGLVQALPALLAVAPAEQFEPNDTIATATVLGSSPTVILQDLALQAGDVDFFKVTAHDTGNLIITSHFIDQLGNLDLRVRDRFGNPIQVSDTDTDNESITIPVVSQEMYFIEVFGNQPNDVNLYDLEIENFPAPVPTGIHLDPASDTGMMNNDGVTNDSTPTFFIQTDVLNFVDSNNDGVYSDPDFIGPPLNPRDAIHVLSAEEAQAIADGTPQTDDEDGGIAVEVTLVNTTTSQLFTFFADPLVDLFPDVFQLTVPNELPDGTYLISARTKVFDGQSDEDNNPDQAMGRSNASPPLWITIDTEAPQGFFDMLPSSDSGMFDNDYVTNKMQPAFFGGIETINLDGQEFIGPRLSEPNTKVTVFAQRTDADGNPIDIGLIVGRGVVDSLGEWEVTVEPLVDGKYNFWAEFEDLAGNFSDPVAARALQSNFTTQAINDNSTINSTIAITAADFPQFVGDAAMTPELIDVNVQVNIQHTFDADLDIFLISPDGTEIELSTDNGGNGDNYSFTVFDDAAGVDINNATLATAPFTGTFRPEEGLFNLNGESPFGQWTLRVTDDAGGDIGQLLSWSLELHIPLMVVIDTEAPNTPFLNLVDAYGKFVRNNMPEVSMTTHDPGIEFAQLLWQDNLKFRIYDRFENTAEFLLYDSTIDPDADAANAAGDMFTAETLLQRMLPNQFFSQVGTNDAVIDVNGVGKLADGLHNLKLEVEDRAGNISEDFLLEIYVDTSPQLGTWAAGEVLLGPTVASIAHGHHGSYGSGFTSPQIGTDLDYIFAGEFLTVAEQILVGDDAVFIIDISGSTSDPFAGDPVGDQNNDGTQNTVLDAEIAAFKLLNQQLIDRGLGNTAQVAIVAFASSASSLDMDPMAAGTQLTTTPLADANGNGMRDVDEVLMALTSGGGTDYEAALSTASATVGSIGIPGINVVFLSDGAPNSSGAHADEVATLRGQNVNLRAFGVGASVPLAELQIIDPNATTFSNTNELLGAFGGGAAGGGQAFLGYDTLAAYGRLYQGGTYLYRWLVDLNGNGYIDPAFEIFEEPLGQGFIGVPLAGNFDGDPTNGDEVGLFTGTQWYLDTDHDFNVTDETPINVNFSGFPIAGDFDGDGDDDLATYIATSSGGNLFSVLENLTNAVTIVDRFAFNPALVPSFSFRVGTSFLAGIGDRGVRERPVSADFNGDGIDDFGLWVPDGRNPVPNELSEWYFFLSEDGNSVLDRIRDRLGNNVQLNGFVNFSPLPDRYATYAQFGNTFALPVVGRFLPPGLVPTLIDDQTPNDNGVEFAQEQDVQLPLQVTSLVEVVSAPTVVTDVQETTVVDLPDNETSEKLVGSELIEQPEIVVTAPELPVENDFAAPSVVVDTTNPTPSTEQPLPPETTVGPELIVDPEFVETTTSTPIEVIPEVEPPQQGAQPGIEPVADVDTEAPSIVAEDSDAELPVVPVEQTSPKKHFRRSRFVRLFRTVTTDSASIVEDLPIVEPASADAVPAVGVAPPSKPEVVDVPEQLETNLTEAELPLETMVIVTPEVEATPEPAPLETVHADALEAVFADVTSLEFSKPDLEPDDDFAAVQAGLWHATQENSPSHRRFRRSRFVF